MPITPRFELSQTDQDVIVEIRVPSVRVSVESVEVTVTESTTLHFASPPYLLILNFPSELSDIDDKGCATYDPSRDGGMVTLKLPKLHPGIWPDLDMMAQLMAPKQPPSLSVGNNGRAAASIEVVSSTDNPVSTEDEEEEIGNETSTQDNLPELRNALKPHYGFLNQHASVFTDLAREGLAAEMLELPYPDETDAQDRRDLRIESEQEKFDPDRYIGDLDVEDDYLYQVAMSMKPHWVVEQDDRKKGDHTISGDDDALVDQMSKLTTDETNDNAIKQEQSKPPETKPRSYRYFTPDETAQLASISYPILPPSIQPQQSQSLFAGLLDILFAYVYDHLLTSGDPTVESSWTITTLSCSLSWLEDYSDTPSCSKVMEYSMRRSLIYPYLRNYSFSVFCWKQVACIVRNGRRCVVRCLLQIRSILEKSESHYLGNRLYIDPYLAWIQRNVNSDNPLLDISLQVRNVIGGTCLGKEALGLDLLQLERNAMEEFNDDSEEEGSTSSEETTDSEDYSSSSTSTNDEESDSNQGYTSDVSSSVTGTDCFSGISGSEQDRTSGLSSGLGVNPGSIHAKQDISQKVTPTKTQQHSSVLLDSELPVSSNKNKTLLGSLTESLPLQEVSSGQEKDSSKPLIEEIS